MRTIIQNGTIVSDTAAFRADLLLEDGVVKAVGAGLSVPDAQVIDASGKYVLPGAVDVHTHMDLQAGAHRAVDDFYTGTVAAACGGTTTIVDHMASAPRAAPCGTRWRSTTVWPTERRSSTTASTACSSMWMNGCSGRWGNSPTGRVSPASRPI